MEMGKIKIADLPAGCVIWNDNDILGITQATLPEKYYERCCVKVLGNDFDYQLLKEVI